MLTRLTAVVVWRNRNSSNKAAPIEPYNNEGIFQARCSVSGLEKIIA